MSAAPTTAGPAPTSSTTQGRPVPQVAVRAFVAAHAAYDAALDEVRRAATRLGRASEPLEDTGLTLAAVAVRDRVYSPELDPPALSIALSLATEAP